jgi:hypothetical protein
LGESSITSPEHKTEIKSVSLPFLEIIVNVNEELVYESNKSIFLYIDVIKSVKESGGNYHFVPVIRAFTNESTGSIEGFIQPQDANPLVSISYDEQTYETCVEPNGYFCLLGLPKGLYNLKASAPPIYLEKNMNAINVLEGEKTNIGTITLLKEGDDEPPLVTINDASANEGDNVQFTVSLSSPTAEDISLTLDLTDGTATAGADYANNNVQVTIPAGSTSVNVYIPTITDLIDEDVEIFFIGVASVNAGTVDSDISDEGIGSIIDDDNAPLITINDASATEGDNVRFTVDLSNPSGEDISVTLNLTDETATGGTDYNNSNIRVTIPAGSTSVNVDVPTIADIIDEDNETFVIGIGSVNAGTVNANISDKGKGTINDDDNAPLITINDASATEGDNIQFTVSLSNPSATDITITFGLMDRTATGGIDYVNSNIQVTIPAGSTSANVSVSTISDSVEEDNETFIIRIVSVDAGTVDANISDQGTGTINDDDKIVANVEGDLNINPATSEENRFEMQTPIGIIDIDVINTEGDTYTYFGTATEIKVMPKAQGRTLNIGGVDVELNTNTRYIITSTGAEMNVELRNTKNGNGNWWIYISGENVTIVPYPVTSK